MTTTTSTSRLADMPTTDEDPYFAGFGQRSLTRSETPRGDLGVEVYTDADAERTVTLYRPSDLAAAAQRSVARGGGVLGLTTESIPASRVVELSSEDYDCMTISEARRLLRARVA